MSSPAKIPATVVTGFLGAGKTSLVRHLLSTANGRRIALIINEFGDVGVDGALIEGCGDDACADGDIVELANGCICCTVADDFVPTMEALLDRPNPPDHIVIETSGLALPKPLVKAFNWPEIRTRVTVDGVITVVDGAAVAEGVFAHDPDRVAAQRAADPALDHDSPLEDLFEDQLACADLVVLNKTDLLDAAGLEAVTARLELETRGVVRVVRARHGAIDAGILLGLGAEAENDLGARSSHHDAEEDHDHDDFESIIVPIGEVSGADAAVRIVERLTADKRVLRVKGFASVAGADMRLVIQAVGPRVQTYFDRDWRGDEPRQSQLVVIGLAGLDRRALNAAVLAGD